MQASLIGPGGQRTELPSDVLTIGRAPDNLLVLQDQQASSHHAEIRPNAQGYLLVDINSRNGTFVNEQRLLPQTPRLLFSGDVIRIGETRLTYAIGGQDEATVRASGADYGNAAYSPTVAVPPSQQPDFASYQQPTPPAPSYQQPPPPAYSNYQQPTPSAPNYPQADQPGYMQQPQGYATPGYPQQPQAYPQQAPWAGTPGQFGVPAAPVAAQPKKKSRTGLIIGIIVLLLLVVGGAVGGFLYVNRSTPEKTLQAYCSALQNGDAQGAYNLLSTRAQSRTSVAQIASAIQIIKSPQVGGIKSCTVTNVQENGSSATADVTVTLGNPSAPSSPGKAFLVNENGSWKIDTSPQSTP
jgi:hypothetical protein